MAEVTRCRSCGAADPEAVLSLGHLPLANALLTAEQLDEPEARYPLDLAFCPACSLLQITATVPPDVMFRDYPYLSSFSQGNVDTARECVEAILASRELGKDGLAMEVGSNDGYLLQFYAQRGIPVLGVDPALNIAPVAAERGVPTICGFFGIDLAMNLVRQGRRADVIHLNNTFAHIADLNGLVAGLALVLKDDGVIVIQVPYVKDMVELVEFDTIYHEHLCYFSVTALDALFRKHGLEIADVQVIPIHGGTLRVFVRKADVTGSAPCPDVVVNLFLDEIALGMDEAGFYQDFGQKVRRLREKLCAMLSGLKADGKSIAGYAASAKGTTLLNYCGIGGETLDYVVDRSTVKQGRYTPGTHLLIEPPERLLEDMPDYALLLAWNYADEIMGREAEYLRRGGRFVIPVPEPAVIGAGGGAEA